MLQSATVGAGGFHESKIAAGDVDPTVDAHRDVVGGVVGGAVFESEGNVGDQSLGRLSHSIAIAVQENGNVRRVKKVEAIVIPDQTAGRIDIAHELGDLISTSVIVLVA